MKDAFKPFLVLLVVAGLGLGITIYGGHKLGAAAVAKHKAHAGDTKGKH
ncbi:MAG: hypothetical protein VYB65_09380 [Myxococcota bacterium]|jgi:hypothetical protein|nr:hypothetical protein [Myxococcota bacterium]